LLVADNKVMLNVNNSFWYGVNFHVKNSFKKTIEQSYDAHSSKVDFAEKSTCNVINNWISKSTNGEIQGFFEPGEINDLTKFVLLDAVFFKGKWKFEVNERHTKQMVFYNHGTTTSYVPTMNVYNVTTTFGGDESVTLIKLPYGNSAYSMYLIMADEGYDINNVISEFDYDRWKTLKETTIDKVLKFSIPKFEIKYKPELEEVIEALGLSCNSPELGNMCEGNATVDYLKIKQGSSIKIDETGSIITTTTSVSGVDSMAGPPANVEYIHINRPFIFLVEEFSTGAILFAGKVVEL
ncbi:MAG: hypothetical protein NC221_06120, partial [Duncaniella sp.]|nr:hypothetical protein [Duncaniella sp.]